MNDQQSDDPNFKPFSQSVIWNLNSEYYQANGLEPWRSGVLPHQISSNSRIAKTIAELILGYLKDLSKKQKLTEKVYIVELGAGHGRLAYHVLKHLDRLIELTHMQVPDYCYVLTDIIEDSLDFFMQHPQFEDYFKNGHLDVSYFDATESEELSLRYAKKKIVAGSLNQSVVAIANYFFDSIPTDLFHVKEGEIKSCLVASTNDKSKVDSDKKGIIENLKLDYKKVPLEKDGYDEKIFNDIVQSYKSTLQDSHVYFPIAGLNCLSRIKQLSTKGMMLISCDKGHHEIYDLQGMDKPDLVQHGSFSILVNFHAFAEYCKRKGGKAFLPTYATNALQFVCLLFEEDHADYEEVNNAYQRFVNDFGPDDYITIKKLSYDKIANMSTEELIAMLRLSYYDSTIFKNYLPRLKQLTSQLSMSDRRRLGQMIHNVWDMYFTIKEPYDLPFELAGFYFDMSFYEEAKFYFGQSIKLFGPKPDTYYNMALCHYQLREDRQLLTLINTAQEAFPDYEQFAELNKLNLAAK